ncbi:MAG: PA14 domain-containing protein,virulence plasmid 28 protein, partial [Gammaproteobacteria bacterium]|nr:PA14 domain-containing protein,virulence plasmid 28 protein [Gammaproteobacteria bacterium]
LLGKSRLFRNSRDRIKIDFSLDDQTGRIDGQECLIIGSVLNKKEGSGIAGIRIEAWDKEFIIDDFLGVATTSEVGRFNLHIKQLYCREVFFVRKPDVYFKLYDKDELIHTTKTSLFWNADDGGIETNIAIDLIANHNTEINIIVNGSVVSRNRAGVEGLQVNIVDKNIGKDTLVAKAITDKTGNYTTTVTLTDLKKERKQSPDLQAHVFAGKQPLGRSEIRYNATEKETLNVILSAQAETALPSEYETLTGTLSSHVKGEIGSLKETEEQQDITYLANKTGWDARAVAMAALAEQFSQRTANETEIAPIIFYALFRAGLPANESALYQADAKTVERILKQSIEQGVIPAAILDSLPSIVKRFENASIARVLDNPALVGVSPLKEMLALTLGDDRAKQKTFTELYNKHRTDSAQLWNEVETVLGATAAKQLKLDGQLAYLTLNNAPLIGKLHNATAQERVTDTLELVQAGYYRADQWKPIIDADFVPTEIISEDENKEQRRDQYAELMAAQVRLSFPTAVVAQMVNNDETPLSQGVAKEPVHTFLRTHQGKFEIGMQPVEQYIARNDLQVSAEVTQEIKRIQRVYQISSNDDAMNHLLNSGMDSAYSVIQYDQDEFIKAFKNDLKGE